MVSFCAVVANVIFTIGFKGVACAGYIRIVEVVPLCARNCPAARPVAESSAASVVLQPICVVPLLLFTVTLTPPFTTGVASVVCTVTISMLLAFAVGSRAQRTDCKYKLQHCLTCNLNLSCTY